MISKEEFVEEMRKIATYNEGDPEGSHLSADELMCKVLTELGYGEGIEIFNSMCLRYA